MSEFRKPSWSGKFRVAIAGVFQAFADQNSFHVHLPCAAAVVGIAAWLQVDQVSWCLLVLCIGAVIAAELFNTSLEEIARAITDQPDDHIRTALDVASGAVLLTSLLAMLVGLIVLGPALWSLVAAK